jgi:hypothetical protein
MLLVLGLLAGARAEFAPLICALPVQTAPKIDGSLDDPCWQAAELSAPLTAIGGAAVKVPTWGKVCWDRKHLYVALICAEPQMAVLREHIARNIVSLYGESIEVFVNPGHDHFAYKQYRVGILGERDTHVQTDGDAAFDARWQGARQLHDDAWTVEMAIPFTVIGMTPKADSLWGLNLNRARSVFPDAGAFCWADTKGPFHNPSRFGHIIFADYPTWLTVYYMQRIAEIQTEMRTLRRRYPVAARAQAAELEALMAQRQAFIAEITTASITNGAQCQPYIHRGDALAAAFDAELDDLRCTIIAHHFR